MTKIIELIGTKIWQEFETYEKVLIYFNGWSINDENFTIYFNKNEKIDVKATLNNMNDDLLFKIAFDMEIQIPGIIYAVPEVIKICLENNFQTASIALEDACKKAYEDPDFACVKANFALETIIKEILKNKKAEYKEKDSLYNLARTILKEFKFSEIEARKVEQIRNLGRGLITACQAIADIRSQYTTVHGKISGDYLIDDPLYSHLLINSAATVGLFLLNFYERKYKIEVEAVDEKPNDDECDGIDF